ncbi:MAG: EF-P beta-lysylation protein EpmB [Gammaproteobacteria bacterium]
MIPRSSASWQIATWQGELAQAISSPADLLAALELTPELLPAALGSAPDFPLRVPRGYVARMRKGDARDPLLLQVLPLSQEQLTVPGFSYDAVGDLAAMTVPGLLHKYHGRVLLVTTGACAIHCRYCFRRHFPYSAANPGTQQWEAAIEYIGADSSIREVILSGGDPLSLTNQRLSVLVERLEKIPHLKYLRIHTRMPIVLPKRIDDGLLNWLTGTRLKPIVVVHANHANEIDDHVRHALALLAARGVSLLNQSVLLRGVNDSAQTLAELSETLFDAGVLPYYLHSLDKVSGAAHFEVDEASACQIMEQLRASLAGYLVPRLVREQRGANSKLAIFSGMAN